MKKKTFYFSINSFLRSQSDYLDGCQIYLLDLWNTDILDQKLSLEKTKSWGESRYFIFVSHSERHHPLPERGLLYNLFHNWLFVAEE